MGSFLRVKLKQVPNESSNDYLSSVPPSTLRDIQYGWIHPRPLTEDSKPSSGPQEREVKRKKKTETERM
jgi:hypothetical protein